jgi:hypothetical protein
VKRLLGVLLAVAAVTAGVGSASVLAGGSPPDSNCPETLVNACSTDTSCPPVAQGWGGDETTTEECPPVETTCDASTLPTGTDCGTTTSTPAETVTVTETVTSPPVTSPAVTETVAAPTQILTVRKPVTTPSVKGKTSTPAKKHKKKKKKAKKVAGRTHRAGGVTG